MFEAVLTKTSRIVSTHGNCDTFTHPREAVEIEGKLKERLESQEEVLLALDDPDSSQPKRRKF